MRPRQPSLGLITAADYVEFHRERLDGSGYPKGLRGSRIPPGVMILGLVEAYSALTEHRPFREAASPADAIATLESTKGVWFPTGLIDALDRAVAAGAGRKPELPAVHKKRPSRTVKSGRARLSSPGRMTSGSLEDRTHVFPFTRGNA